MAHRPLYSTPMTHVSDWFRSLNLHGGRLIQAVSGPQRRLVVALLSLALLLLGALTPAAQADPHGCTGADVNANCNFNNFYSSPYGSVPDGWTPFVLSGSPAFVEAVDTYFGPPSLQIWSDGGTFQAGIFQQVRNLTPGATYLASVGWAAANEPNAFGRKLGLDPTGGTDPTAPTVIWGTMHYGPGRFGNYSTPGDPNLDVRAAAKGDTMTLFFLVDHNYSTGVNLIFVDAISLVRDESQPVAPAEPPTATPRPAPRSAARPLARPTSAPTSTDTPSPTATPSATVTATATHTPSPTATPTDTSTPSATPTATRLPRATATPTAAPAGLSGLARAHRPLLLPVGFTALFGSVGLGGVLKRRRARRYF
ncbi:hypothetical protein [Candidatus Amarolinea aalborgensis]|uniref:hypothetical protein n=1 Tax=Candidatus Amarolinea aalborgensis TaxID=2249329 RepID=UPI003BFA291E